MSPSFLEIYLTFADDLRYVRGKGSRQSVVYLVDESDMVYTKNQFKGERAYWRCVSFHKGCHCKLVTVNGRLTSITGYHNHPSNYDPSKYDELGS